MLRVLYTIQISTNSIVYSVCRSLEYIYICSQYSISVNGLVFKYCACINSKLSVHHILRCPFLADWIGPQCGLQLLEHIHLKVWHAVCLKMLFFLLTVWTVKPDICEISHFWNTQTWHQQPCHSNPVSPSILKTSCLKKTNKKKICIIFYIVLLPDWQMIILDIAEYSVLFIITCVLIFHYYTQWNCIHILCITTYIKKKNSLDRTPLCMPIGNEPHRWWHTMQR